MWPRGPPEALPLPVSAVLGPRLMRRLLYGTVVALGVLAVGESTCQVFFRVFADRFKFANPERYTLSAERIARLRSGFDPVLGWRSHFMSPHGERPSFPAGGFHRSYMATFGDSTVFGDEVADDETWETYLGKLLGADVSNFGISGQAPDQGLIRMRQVVAQGFAPPILCLHVGPENINRIVNRFRPFYYRDTGVPFTKPRFALENGKLKLLPNPIRSVAELDRLSDPDFIDQIGQQDVWYSRHDLPRLGFPYLRLLFDPRLWRQALHHPRLANDNNPLPFVNLWRQEDARRLYFAIIDAFASEARAAGSRPLFVLLPGRAVADAQREHRGIPGYNRIRRYCRRRGYECFDGIAWLTRHADAAVFDTYFAPGGHCSARGNKLTAEGLRDFLVARHLAPPILGLRREKSGRQAGEGRIVARSQMRGPRDHPGRH
jgi:hypothetical protein